MQYVQLPVGTLPIRLNLYPAVAGVALVRAPAFQLVADLDYEGKDAVEAYFFLACFVLCEKNECADEGEDFHYGHIYHYKNHPRLLKWLQQQKLSAPVFPQ